MKKAFKGLLLIGSLAILSSCGNEDGFSNSGSEGKLTLDLSSDGRVLMDTRADDTKVSVVPQPSQFAISLEKQDGSLSKKWVNVDAFNRETGFPIGTYTISANYGNIEQEGFELPCFSASQNVLVEAGQESHVFLNATLDNAMVSIRYKDEFTSRFAAYSASLKSESSADRVMFAQNEDRPAYMKPEVIELRLSLANAQGQEVTVAPYSFTAQPRHHYVVNLGVNDANGSGDIKLDVQITEEVESEFVEISLGDDLFNAPAPAVKACDFPVDMKFEGFEGLIAENDPRVDVLAYGGMRKVNLNVETANELPFGKSVQLVGAEPSLQDALAKSGIRAEGFFRNPDKAGVIKFKDFISNLPKGTYKVTVDAEDARTLVSAPVEFTVIVNAVEVKMAMVKAPEFMGEEMTVAVTTNNPDIKDALRFQVADDHGDWVNAEVVEAASQARTRAAGEYAFSYRISVPTLTKDRIKVQTLFGLDNQVMASIDETGLIFPEYAVEVDAFAHKAWLQVTAKDAAKQEIVFDNFKLFKDGNADGSYLSVLDKEQGIYELTNLAAATSYANYSSSLGKDTQDNPKQAIAAFTTETTPELPNGDFSATTETINIGNIQVGGKWKVALTEYTTKSSILCSTPDNWATLNQLTCWEGASNKNTWFMVPSSFGDNGQTVIRSVGYHHNGVTPATTSASMNHYYCSNVPSDLEKVAGELFLGSYSFDGTEHRVNGIDWNVRPQSVEFYYKYQPLNNEQGEAYVNLLDKDGAVIAKGGMFISAGENSHAVMEIENYSFGKKPVRMELGFRSTRNGMTPAIHIPAGDEMNEGFTSSNFVTSGQKVATNNYHSLAVGSVLTIDNVKLNYGDNRQTARKRTSKAVKK